MSNPNIHVSAAIICRHGKVLSCRRAHGPHAGKWEFPGGKLEHGEDALTACRREIAEELDCRLSTSWLFHTIEYDYPTFHLTMDCFVCAPLQDSEPQPKEHDRVRWLNKGELLDVEWLDADIEVVKLVSMYWDQLFASEHL